MINKLLDKFDGLLTGVEFLFEIRATDQRSAVETFTHEIAHLLTLFGTKKTKEIINECLSKRKKININSYVKELKTLKAQDNNEIKTTAITILAVEQLGGGTFQESMKSMVGNLQATDSKVKNKEYINKCVELMMSDRIQGQANILARMLLDLDKSLS